MNKSKTGALMARLSCLALLCGFFFAAPLHAQEVVIMREAKLPSPKVQAVVPAEMHVEKAIAVEPVKAVVPEKPSVSVASPPAKKPVIEVHSQAGTKTASTNSAAQKPEATVASAPLPKSAVVAAKPVVALPSTEPVLSRPATKPETAYAKPVKPPATPVQSAVAQTKKTDVVASASTKTENNAPRPVVKQTSVPDPAPQTVSFSGDSAFIKLADGFDFPVGKPDAQSYYKARGFRSRGHLGEDWDGVGGGDTDLGDPIYSIGDGVVVFARDVHMGWGNVVIVRHSYREGGVVKNIDALYGHLHNMLVHRGQAVSRGQKIATMGNAHGLYDAHLHIEIRKNIEIGMSRAAFARDFSNYYDPSHFIASHRHLQTNGAKYRVAMNTFTRDAKINFAKARNYSRARSGGGTGESAAALKRALASSKR